MSSLPAIQSTQSPASRFHADALSTMVAPGAVSSTSVLIQGRTYRPGKHRLRLRSLASDADRHELSFTPTVDLKATDGTFTVAYPGHHGRPLSPATPYAFDVLPEGSEPLGEGQFRTAPVVGSRAAQRVTLGLMSCHNPFSDEGEVQSSALRTLEAAPAALEAAGVSRLLLAGDQVYGDMPQRFSLFDDTYFAEVGPPDRDSILDCTAAEVRALYQRRHRVFWKMEAMRRLQSSFACHPILDDHEIVDNFGSDPAHATPRWRSLKRGALDAFFDYQARRVFGNRRRRVFDHGFRHGALAAYVLDLRSRRRAKGGQIEILGAAQRARFARFLAEHADAAAVVVVLSVPILHVPDWAATLAAKVTGEGSDAADRWSCASAQASRDRLLQVLVSHRDAHPHQRLILAGGDIHVGACMRFRLGDGADAMQLVSSAISNPQGALKEWLAESLPEVRSRMGRRRGQVTEASLVEGVAGADQNPFGGLNFGVIDIEVSPSEACVRGRLLSAGDGPASTVFDTGWM